MTKCVVDKSVSFFWFKTALRFKTSFAFAAFRSRLPPSDPTPRGKAESIVKYGARLSPIEKNALRIETSSALGAQLALPSSAHRRLTWNAEAAVAAGRAPGSGQGSVGRERLIMKKRVAARDVLAFCPQHGAAARDVLRFCRPRNPHPAAGQKTILMCGVFWQPLGRSYFDRVDGS